MDDQIMAEMMTAWTTLSNLVLIGLLASAALIAAMGSRRPVRASIRTGRR
jgi:hypothetical protein